MIAKQEKFKGASKGMMIKSLAEKKEKETRVTFSVSIERQAKDILDSASSEYSLSSSYIINELIKRNLG